MKEVKTYIGGAEIRYDDTERRDKLVKAAKKAGFLVECDEAIDVSFSGKTTPCYWSISVSIEGKIDNMSRKEAKRKLAAAWNNL